MIDISKLQKTMLAVQTRAQKLNSFLVKLEAKVLVLPSEVTFEAGSPRHLEFLELYAKLLKCMEGVLESSRRSILLEKEIMDRESNDVERDELYRMLKSMDADEIIGLKNAYLGMKGTDGVQLTQ